MGKLHLYLKKPCHYIQKSNNTQFYRNEGISMTKETVLHELRAIHDLITVRYPKLTPDSLEAVLDEYTAENKELTRTVLPHIDTISKTMKITHLVPQANRCFLATVFRFISIYTDAKQYVFNAECVNTYNKRSIATIQLMYALQKELSTIQQPVSYSIYSSYVYRYDELVSSWEKLCKTQLYATQMAFTEKLLSAVIIEEDMLGNTTKEKELLPC